MSLLLAYHTLTRGEMTSTKASMDSARGLYAAEAGLNLRADQVRQIFEGYNRPAGTSPTAAGACAGTNVGSGDFACTDHDFENRLVSTYLLGHTINRYVVKDWLAPECDAPTLSFQARVLREAFDAALLTMILPASCARCALDGRYSTTFASSSSTR